MPIQYTIRVFGKVQGVWFRQTTKDIADQLGLKGIVLNDMDGSVFIIAQGEESALTKFIDYCKSGPKGAEVGNVHVEEDEWKEFKGFEVIR